MTHGNPFIQKSCKISSKNVGREEQVSDFEQFLKGIDFSNQLKIKFPGCMQI